MNIKSNVLFLSLALIVSMACETNAHAGLKTAFTKTACMAMCKQHLGYPDVAPTGITSLFCSSNNCTDTCNKFMGPVDVCAIADKAYKAIKGSSCVPLSMKRIADFNGAILASFCFK
jgi:hypothetical protein